MIDVKSEYNQRTFSGVIMVSTPPSNPCAPRVWDFIEKYAQEHNFNHPPLVQHNGMRCALLKVDDVFKDQFENINRFVTQETQAIEKITGMISRTGNYFVGQNDVTIVTDTLTMTEIAQNLVHHNSNITFDGQRCHIPYATAQEALRIVDTIKEQVMWNSDKLAEERMFLHETSNGCLTEVDRWDPAREHYGQFANFYQRPIVMTEKTNEGTMLMVHGCDSHPEINDIQMGPLSQMNYRSYLETLHENLDQPVNDEMELDD